MNLPIEKVLGNFKRLAHLFPAKPPELQVTRRIGLNIGKSNLVASEIRIEEGKHFLERCVRKPIQEEKPLAAQVKDFLRESGFQSKEVSVSLKGQGVVVRFLSFPKMSRTDFASSIQFEAEKYLPFNVADVFLDYHMVDSTSGSAKDANLMDVVLVAARKSEVDRLLHLAKEIGFKLRAIDVDIFACANAFESTEPSAKSAAVALVDFGAGDTTLGILDKGTLRFSRDIAFGGNDLTEFIRRKLNMTREDAVKLQINLSSAPADQVAVVEEGLGRLFQELRSSITYYYNQHENATPIETLYISGGFSQLSVLPGMLEKQIETPVKKWDPTTTLTVADTITPDAIRELLPYLPVSIGLAIRPS